MIYVGIDVASEKHDFVLMNSDNIFYTKHSITISNTIEGYKKLHNTIQEFCGANKDFKVRIGLESTSIYQNNLLDYLLFNNYEVMLLNPLLTHLHKKSKKVHTAKNDNLDSKAICEYISDPKITFTPYTLISYHTQALKSLSRERFKLVEQLRKDKLKIYNLIVQIFPELLKLFTNVYQGSIKDIMIRYGNPKSISNAHLSTLESMIHGHCKTNASALQLAAKNSIGNNSSYLSLNLRLAYRFLDETIKMINQYDELIKYHVDLLNTPILTIPGMGYTTAGLFLGEIGDINNYKNADHIVSFSGLDIKVYESGKYSSKNESISKKGSKYLRYALYQVAKTIWRFDPQFSNYYNKKKSENKHFYVILGHIEKKVIKVIYSVLKNNKPYYIPQK